MAVITAVSNPRQDFEANALGAFTVLAAARLAADDPILIYASTNKVYGGMAELRIIEREARYAYADWPCGIPEAYPLDFHSPKLVPRGAAINIRLMGASGHWRKIDR